QALADADEGVDPGHRPEHGADRRPADTAEGVLEDEGERAGQDRHERGDHGRGHGRQPGLGEDLQHPPEHRPGDEGGDEGDVGHVDAEGADPAVGEEQGLDDDHHRDDDGTHPGPQQDGGESATHEVARHPRQDREVEHLQGEDQRRGDTGEGDVEVTEPPSRVAQRHAQPSGGDDAGADGGGGVDETIGYVHQDDSLLQMPCNKDSQSAADPGSSRWLRQRETMAKWTVPGSYPCLSSSSARGPSSSSGRSTVRPHRSQTRWWCSSSLRWMTLAPCPRWTWWTIPASWRASTVR